MTGAPSDKQTILITGGAEGLGLALARRFTAEGDDVFVCARTDAALKRAALELPSLVTIQADVTRSADRDRLWGEIASRTPRVDILINNAGIARPHDYTDDFTLQSDRARDEIEINFAAPVEMVRLFLAQRRHAGQDGVPATIVTIGTPGGLIPLDAIPLYCATKAGLHMFTTILREQLRSTLVKVVEVFPPALDTGLTKSLHVASQAAHGDDIIMAVAGAIVNGIRSGDEIILPHAQSRELFGAIPQLDPTFVEIVNQGVRRRHDWNRPS